MANFYGAHKLSIEQEFNISSSQIQKGMILGFNYKSKRYLVITLNASYQGKLHALTLDNFSPYILDRMASKLGVIYSKKLQRLLMINIPHLIMEKSSSRFYHADIKPFIEQKGYLNYSYRMFFNNKIGGLYAANYKFGPKIMELLEEQKVIK